MVKIINGEIVADNDPRLQQRQPPPQGPSGGAGPGRSGGAGRSDSGPAAGTGGPQAQAPAPGGGTGFNLSAPPLRTIPPAPGSDALLGLPDLEVFGVRVTPYAILAAAGLGVMFGWRGVMIAIVLYYVYLANQGNPANQPGGQAQAQGQGQRPGQGHGQQQQQQQQAGGSGPMDFLQNYLNGPRPRGAGAQAEQGGNAQAGGGNRPPPQQQQRQQQEVGGQGGGAGGDGPWSAFKGPGNKLGKS